MERWKRNLYLISAAEFLTILGFTAIYPFMVYFIQELGVTDLEEVAVWAGLVSSAPALTMAVFAPIWGVLADRYGRKLMLERAIFGAAVCLGLMGLTQNVHQFFQSGSYKDASLVRWGLRLPWLQQPLHGKKQGMAWD
ncbi:MAG: MFS transporter [Chloroflexota bacterium]